jgi:DNA helicase-2/ATP-dependent DNA helicase PcrA
MAYLNLISNHDDDIRLMRVINVPKRGIGETTIRNAYDIAQGMGTSLFNIIEEADTYDKLYRSAVKLKSFTDLIKKITDASQSASLSDLFDIVMRETGYRESLRADEDSEDRIQNLDQLKSEIVQYMADAEEPTLEGFLQDVALSSDQDELTDGDDYVPLMTLHASKGLEFPVVFIIGMEESIFPSRQCMFDPNEVEEERRLAYVGITRAKDKLYLTKSESRMMYGCTNRNRQSRFIDEIPEEYCEKTGESVFRISQKPDAVNISQARKSSPYKVDRSFGQAVGVSDIPSFKPGDKVKHKTFGEGMIISAEEMGSDVLLEIAFDTVGTKKLLARFARLTKI